MKENSREGFRVTTTTQKWGGSTGVRIPHRLVEKYNIVPGTRVEISDDGERITIQRVKEKPTLEELLAKCTPENNHDDLDFGGPVGRELL